SFVKTGSGLLSMRTSSAGNTWANTGGVTVNGGVLRYDVSPNGTFAGFADTVTVTLNNGGTLNMNDISDTYGALSGSAGGVVLTGTNTGANITLAGTQSTTYSGTISGSGTLTKSGSGTQYLNGANTFTGTTT